MKFINEVGSRKDSENCFDFLCSRRWGRCFFPEPRRRWKMFLSGQGPCREISLHFSFLPLASKDFAFRYFRNKWTRHKLPPLFISFSLFNSDFSFLCLFAILSQVLVSLSLSLSLSVILCVSVFFNFNSFHHFSSLFFYLSV